MTSAWSPWSIPSSSRDDDTSWSFSFTRESEAMDMFAIPLDRTEALAFALGMPADALVDQLKNGRPEPALIEAWEALVGRDRETGIARLEAAGLAPRGAGTWIPFGDYGRFVGPKDNAFALGSTSPPAAQSPTEPSP